jgi:hypothetical protein
MNKVMRFHLPLFALALSLIPTRFSPGMQADTLDVCRIALGGRVTGASSDICEQVVRRWGLLFAAPVAPGVIRVVAAEGYRGAISPDEWVLETPRPAPTRTAAPRRASDGLLVYFADDVIPHEAGHQVFGAYVRELSAAATSEHYGSVAPDWIDEAPAVWMESRTRRERRMLTVRGTTPSLAKLVTMAHPGIEFVRENFLSADFHTTVRTVTPPCSRCTWLPDSLRTKYQIIDVGVDARGRPDTLAWYSDRTPDPTDTLEQREFYPLAYSLLRFIRIRGGAAAVNELVVRYRRNPAPRVEVLAGLPGLPQSIGDLEKAWHAFLRNPPPEDP